MKQLSTQLPFPVFHRWDELDELYPMDRSLVTVKKKHVFVYKVKDEKKAVKILQDVDPVVEQEMRNGLALNELAGVGKTFIFIHTYGYLLSPDLPPGRTLKPFESGEPNYYIYMFIESVNHTFDELEDSPKVNETFFFQILIGLYHARKQFNFCHYDIHTGNLMFNRLSGTVNRDYQIVPGLTVQMENVTVEAKLIDYGKSVFDRHYTDKQWEKPRFQKFWDKSDIYALCKIFQFRNLSDKMRLFIEKTMAHFKEAEWIRGVAKPKIANDSAARYDNIERLLRDYWGTCVTCKVKANLYDPVTGKMYCSKGCFQ